jgi:hypothetical protein
MTCVRWRHDGPRRKHDRAMCEKCREMDESDRYAARAGDAARSVTGGSVAQHVSVDRERQLSGLAKPFYELLCTIHRQRRLTLGQKHKVRMGMLAPKCPQQPQFVPLQTVNARRAVLGAADVDSRGIDGFAASGYRPARSPAARGGRPS